MVPMRIPTLAALLLAAAASPAGAQGPSVPAGAAPEGVIEDNSFLVEEAYNQSAGVVQHISLFQNDRRGGWDYAFTQEWPLFGQRHQLSYTIPVSRRAGDAGIGDVAVDYRVQILGVGGGRVALAPRLSVVLPTGDEEAGRGTGSLGVQTNLPLSVELSPALISHSNAGFAVASRDDGGDQTVWSAAQSVVWLARRDLNLLLEAAWSREEARGVRETFFLSPGVRTAFDLRGGLQVVPGVAVPIGVGPSDGEWSVLLYLSLEHPLFRRAR